MTVSVIIPCYNNEKYIEDAINSALQQTYRDVEVIVINDGSTDMSVKKISAFRNRIIFIDQKNQGACAARNAGISASTGDWIKFLDGDDYLYPDCIERQLEGVDSESVVQFGYPTIVDEEGNIIREDHHIQWNTFQPGQHAELEDFLNFPILISTPLFPAEILKTSGGFDPTVRRGQEHELHLRLFLSGFDFRFWPVQCFAYRQHQSTSRISISRRTESYFATLERFESLVRTARTGPRADRFESDRHALAHSAWRTGRRKLRESNDVETARQFFRLSKELGGETAAYGRPFYKKLVRFVDPVFLERVMVGVRSGTAIWRKK